MYDRSDHDDCALARHAHRCDDLARVAPADEPIVVKAGSLVFRFDGERLEISLRLVASRCVARVARERRRAQWLALERVWPRFAAS